MQSLSIGIRDYTLHLIPGLVYIYTLVFVLGISLSSSYTSVDVALVLVGGYLAGFFSDSVFSRWLLSLIRRIPLYADPLRSDSLLDRSAFEVAARKKLSEHIGEELVGVLSLSQICYTYLRYIQIKNQNAFEFSDRFNALSNLCISLIPPVVFTTISLILFQNYIFAAICMIVVLRLPYRNNRYRTLFKKAVERQYLLLRFELNPSDSSTSKLQKAAD